MKFVVSVFALSAVFGLSSCTSNSETSGDLLSAKEKRKYLTKEELNHPNIVMFYVDDFGWTDARTLGSDYYITPNIDKLFEKSKRFTSAYSWTNCAPSRASLMTGLYPTRTGMYTVGQAEKGDDTKKLLRSAPNTLRLNSSFVTFPEILVDAGYDTAHIGKWHLGDVITGTDPLSQGFKYNVGGNLTGTPPLKNGEMCYFSDANGVFNLPNLPANGMSEQYLPDRLTSEAKFWLENVRDKSKPFFLYFSHFSVHAPIQATDADVSVLDSLPRGRQHDNLTYASMVYSIDRSLGEVIDYLENAPLNINGDNGLTLADNTVIIFYSDNGGWLGNATKITSNYPLKGGKGSLYEGGIRVPLAIRWDGVVEPNSVSNRVISNIDFLPTILRLINYDGVLKSNPDGVNFLNELVGTGTQGVRPAVFWHFPGYLPHGYQGEEWRTKPVTAMRRGKFKLIYQYESECFELYDLESDIGENHNLVTVYPDVAASLATTMNNWLVTMHSPLPIRKDNGEVAALPLATNIQACI